MRIIGIQDLGCSNCTLLELKEDEVADEVPCVIRSNCTLLELKEWRENRPLDERIGSNCTLLELKGEFWAELRRRRAF